LTKHCITRLSDEKRSHYATTPFVSTTTFGDRDAYRVAVGIIDAVRSGQYLASPLLYGLDKSFAYFALINLFTPLFREKPETIISVLNYLNAFASILTIIPYYLLVKKYWGMRAAVLANLLLISVPVWRQTSLYSHPMTLAIRNIGMSTSLSTQG
jgi:hypothetical protein